MPKIAFRSWLLLAAICVSVALPQAANARRHHRHHREKARGQTRTPAPFPPPATGCLPVKERILQCEEALAKAAGKLITRVERCHGKQASQAFGVAELVGFDEEKCERSAKRKFDGDLAEAREVGGCPSGVSTTAAQFRDLVVDRADANNKLLYCEGNGGSPAGAFDSTSGALIDPAGDDTGFIPSSEQTLGCANEVGDELGDLSRDLLRCNANAADAFEDRESYDLDKCRTKARDKYRSEIDETMAEFRCPGCLDVPGQVAVGDLLIALLNEQNQLIFPCPGGVVTTTTTSTTQPTGTTSTTTSTTGPTATTTSSTSTTTSPSATSTSTTTTTQGSTTTTTTTHASTTTTTATNASTTTTTTTTTAPTVTTTSTTTTTTTTTTAAQPHLVDFTLGAGTGNCGTVAPGGIASGHLINPDGTHLSCSGLAIGGGGSSVGEGLNPSGTTTRYGISGCAASVCTVQGVADAGLPAGVDGSKAGSLFGTPLPIPNLASPGLSTCVRNTFASDASGTINVATGVASLGVPLTTTTWVTGNVSQPCPKCVVSGTPSPTNPLTGTCDRGATTGGACTTVNPNGLTKNCLPGGADGSFQLPAFSVDLTPLVTGSSNKASATGMFCPSQAQAGCFGGDATKCNSITQTGSAAGALPLNTSKAVTLASVFCIPAANNALIDGAASLPGPGATTLVGAFKALP